MMVQFSTPYTDHVTHCHR